MDLLMYPEGPRIRDRLSHGEAHLDEISDDAASVIWSIVLSINALFMPDDSPAFKVIIRPLVTMPSTCHKCKIPHIFLDSNHQGNMQIYQEILLLVSPYIQAQD